MVTIAFIYATLLAGNSFISIGGIRLRAISFIILVCLLAGCSTSTEEDLVIHAFKVGKADSFLIEHDSEYVLIDAGEEDDGEDIVKYLQQHNIYRLKALIVTHYDKDHVGGADYIVEALDIEHIYVPNYESDSKQTKQFLKAVNKAGNTLEKLTKVTNIKVGSANGTIYPPMKNSYNGDNDYSLVVSLTYGETGFLFAGDIEEERIADLLADTTIDWQHTFLKVPHHGRFNDETTAFFEAVQPQVALITSSDKKPEEDAVVSALQAVDAKIFKTRAGDVEVTSDGTDIFVDQ